ncbi:MAG: DUF4129 domain-containing protein [Planctomycetota bacterium]|nr:DUF4129 domain-containing protein [Planctomycetota bacterium]
MDVNRLFRRLLLGQVMLGLIAFCIAAQSYGLLLAAGGIVLLSWYIVEGAGGRSLPHWATVAGSGIAAGWLLLDLPTSRSGFVLGIGYFSLALQILLIFSRKTNREYAMILILSVMQIVGASVLSVSILYGLLLTAYSCLAIVTILAFQIKATGDLVHANTRAALPPHASDPVINPAAGRGQRWQFRLTALALGAACSIVGAVVFVLSPRDDAPRVQPQFLNEMRPREVGYTTSVDLTKPPEGNSTNNNPVAHLTLSFHGQPMQNGANWHLRGAALDNYDQGSATWRRSQRMNASDDLHGNVSRGIDLADTPDGAPIIDAKVVLRSNVDNTLFTLSPVLWVRAPQLETVVFSREDRRLSVRQRFAPPLEYEFRSLMMRPGLRGAPPAVSADANRPASYPPRLRTTRPKAGDLVDSLKAQAGRLAAGTGFFGPEDFARAVASPGPSGPGDALSRPDAPGPDAAGNDGDDSMRVWQVNTEQIRTFAQGILRDAGLERDPHDVNNPRDPECAQALMAYLRKNYEYSLTRPPLAANAEPITDFLFTNRLGHCELFASALTAMARSLGMTARMVTGYLVNEYNEVGGYYVVRQSHAHTWTEIYCGKLGWLEFDATPAGSNVATSTARGRFAAVRELYDHVEYYWISSIVAYDARTRKEFLAFVQRATYGVADFVGNFASRTWHAWVTSKFLSGIGGKRIIAGVMLGVIVLASLASLLRVLLLRRRRIKTLDLRGVPRSQRPALLRSLRFYMDTLDLLERHGHIRPASQSPMNFADAVARAAPDRLAPVTDLTEAFYELRFGGRTFDEAFHARVREKLRQLEAGLRAAPPAAPRSSD